MKKILVANLFFMILQISQCSAWILGKVLNESGRSATLYQVDEFGNSGNPIFIFAGQEQVLNIKCPCNVDGCIKIAIDGKNFSIMEGLYNDIWATWLYSEGNKTFKNLGYAANSGTMVYDIKITLVEKKCGSKKHPKTRFDPSFSLVESK